MHDANTADHDGSRQSLKKYVKANNQLGSTTDAMFDSLFNKALRLGVQKGHFEQPKGECLPCCFVPPVAVTSIRPFLLLLLIPPFRCPRIYVTTDPC